MTTQDKTNWIKYLPKTWKSVLSVIMILGVPATPFIKSTVDGYLDNRIEDKTIPLQKTQDSLFVVSQEARKSVDELRKSTEQLSTDVRELHKWLIEHNTSNKKYGK